MGFLPGAWKDGGVGPAAGGGWALLAWQPSRAECRKCDGTVDACPQTCFPPHGPALTSKNHSPPSQSEKRQAQPGLRSICSCSWAPFPAEQLMCAVKMLVFPKPKQSKIKSKPQTNHQLGNFCGWNVPKSEALSRHNPCSEGVSPPPLLYKDNKRKQSDLFRTVHRSNQKRREASNYRSLTIIIIIKFLLNTQGSLQRSPPNWGTLE